MWKLITKTRHIVLSYFKSNYWIVLVGGCVINEEQKTLEIFTTVLFLQKRNTCLYIKLHLMGNFDAFCICVTKIFHPWHKAVCSVCCLCSGSLCSCLSQGMGGQHGYFGLWLDSEFGRGHSRARPKCTTYGSPQLSAEEDFSLDALEVWAVSEPPEQEQVRTWHTHTHTQTQTHTHSDRHLQTQI